MSYNVAFIKCIAETQRLNTSQIGYVTLVIQSETGSSGLFVVLTPGSADCSHGFLVHV